MHTIDPAGDILDLSGVTDGTSFNFRDYYKDSAAGRHVDRRSRDG